jgi:hypothetical protein
MPPPTFFTGSASPSPTTPALPALTLPAVGRWRALTRSTGAARGHRRPPHLRIPPRSAGEPLPDLSPRPVRSRSQSPSCSQISLTRSRISIPSPARRSTAPPVNAAGFAIRFVCFLGFGGFVVSCLVKPLLSRGYVVHATIRDPSIPFAATSHFLHRHRFVSS